MFRAGGGIGCGTGSDLDARYPDLSVRSDMVEDTPLAGLLSQLSAVRHARTSARIAPTRSCTSRGSVVVVRDSLAGIFAPGHSSITPLDTIDKLAARANDHITEVGRP